MLRYHLDDLGWSQFEELCQSLLKSLFGHGIASWGGGTDFGRDAYCDFPITITNGTILTPPILFQVKFVNGANAAGAKPDAQLLHAIEAEGRRIKSRIRSLTWKRPTTYVLMTNVNLTSMRRRKAEDAILRFTPNSAVLSWGGKDVCDFLDSTPNIRQAYPLILGLRDLDLLLADALSTATRERSKAQIEKAKKLSPIFYPPRAYYQTLETLRTHNFAVLVGPPEVGKTCVALMVGLAMMSSEGWEFLDCITPDQLLGTLKRSKRQIFFVDDAFGSTEYQSHRAAPWGDNLESVLHHLDKTHWLIWTSRPAPLHTALAKMHLQGDAESFPDPAKVTIDASDLTVQEKANILYRHAKTAGLSNDAKAIVRKYAQTIVASKHFTPERIRRFVTNSLSTLTMPSESSESEWALLRDYIEQEIQRPTTRMRKAFDSLNDEEKSFLISLVDSDESDESEITAAYARHTENNASMSARQIIDLLDGQFIHREDI